ncbi:hypothetical protein XENORESO_008140 [Xenotaenia resolanae]|uniref:Uncharacterized protein n=1 Tax=Xenotaenia resolanae TaxID=208358 RepID=A0ABV0WAJ5_9TELE
MDAREDMENLLSVIFIFWGGLMVGPEGDTCADTAVPDQKEGQLKEAPPWKTKRGVCQRSRKRARQSICHHTSICSLSSCRQALSQPAATSRGCSMTCGGAKAFQGEGVSL